MTTRLLQRQILPLDRDLDVLPLYVDVEDAVLDADKYDVGGTRGAKQLNMAALRQATATGRQLHPEQILSRTALRVPAQEKLSFGTYFNGFPASYWRRYSVVDQVRLTIVVRGKGASVVVHKSMAAGTSQRVEAAETGDQESTTFSFDLTLKPFVDGGWYWYDVLAGDHDVVVESAEWTAEVPEDRVDHGTVDIAITTMNRPDFCAKLLGQIGEDEVLRPYLDTVFVMEQGTDKVVGSDYFGAAEQALGDQLRILEQGNLGGSGGYARGQLESLRKGTATYALMMDDDVVCEPEGIIRAVTLADLAKRPTIVGGHMFNIYSRSRMHSFGEVVKMWRFWWQSAAGVMNDWDFGARNLRSTRWLHKRVDVDYNGWFMCLIPRQVISDIGLSLPLFLKWDDSEYGLRAKEAGYPTVTFPGAAVWHVPWTGKNDAVDWQSFFHHRNRLVAALLHTPYPRSGWLVRESFAYQVSHLVSMQYSTAELRCRAIEDVLSGPEHLHDVLGTKLGEVREFVKQFPDAQLEVEREAFPSVRRAKPSRSDDTDVPGRASVLLGAALMPLRQLRKPRPLSRDFPEAEIAAMDAKWYRLGKYDSAVVSMNDGTSAAMYQREPERFRALMRRSIELHQRLAREWPQLAAEYREKLADTTSPETWERTFAPWLEEPSDD